jgi:hypothetical protein
MVRQSLPRVLDDQLMLPDRADQSFLAIQVGSEAWYAWLDEPATRSFAFHSPQGPLTARPQHRYATWYLQRLSPLWVVLWAWPNLRVTSASSWMKGH